MADEKKPARKSRGEDLYDSEAMTKARKEEPAAKKEAGAEPTRNDGKGNDAHAMLGSHKKARQAMHMAHEAARRDEHNRQRDEHRTMAARHQTEHDGARDHGHMVEMHRRHEHEHHRMMADHGDRMAAMGRRHADEMHDLNAQHEAEMMQAAQGGEAAPTPGAGNAAGGGTPAAPPAMPTQAAA